MVELAGQNNTVFAACLLDQDMHMIASDVNTSKTDGPTAHAEMNLLRRVSKRGKLDAGSILITSCEPCPMCMGAAIWTGVDKIYYGVSIKEASRFMNQIDVYSADMAKASFRRVEIYSGIEYRICYKLFEDRYGRL